MPDQDLCEMFADALLGAVRSGFNCSHLSEGRMLLAVADAFADGDSPEILITRRGEQFIATDFGTVLARISAVGVNPEADSVRAALGQTVAGFDVDYFNSELRLTFTLDDAGDALLRLVNCMLQVDALRWMATEPRGERFATRLIDWLKQLPDSTTEVGPLVRGRTGKPYRLTAAVAITDPVYVQAVTPGASRGETRSVDHTFRVFSDVNGQLAPHQKLVILGETLSAFDLADIQLLRRVAVVGAWWERARLQAYFLSPPVHDTEHLLFDTPLSLDIN